MLFIEVDLTSLILRSVLCGSRSDSRIPGVHTTLHQLYAVTFDRFSSCYDNRAVRNTANVLPFFYLPSLKKMSITIHDPLVPIFPWPTTQPPSSPSLTSLRVVSMRESHLGQVLVTLPRLRSLHWTWCFDPDVEDQFNSPVINLDQLMPALAYVKETLTELIMPAVCYYANIAATPFPLHVRGFARALARFDHLTKLVIPLVFITKFTLPVRDRLANCLPHNLEDLTLTDDLYTDIDINEAWDEAGYTNAIVTWMTDMKTSTPRLRKLCLVLATPDEWVSLEDLGARNEIRELGRRMGIEVTTETVYDSKAEEQ